MYIAGASAKYCKPANLYFFGFDTNSTSILQNVCFLTDINAWLPFGGHLMVVVLVIGSGIGSGSGYPDLICGSDIGIR